MLLHCVVLKRKMMSIYLRPASHHTVILNITCNVLQNEYESYCEAFYTQYGDANEENIG